MNNWAKIFTTRNSAEANIIKGMLEENDIEAVIMNKQDSSYLNFGNIEVYVPKEFEAIAIGLVNKALSN
jgi:hypothetical protein